MRDDDTWTEATDVEIDRVDLVTTAANGTAFLIQKSAAEGLLKAADVAELIGEATEPVAKADGDGEITSDLDVTEPLADDAENAPGATSMPGSPAWEAVDAATARKWAAILARAKNAVCLLADRERTEGDVGDTDDYDNAWDLEDAACAIDCAISLLAPYALGEQMEVEFGSDSPMEDVAKAAKALVDDSSALETVELLAPLTKAGRVFSAANESTMRGAVEQIETAAESLKNMLSSLPAAADAEPVEKAAETTEEPDMAKSTPLTVEVQVAPVINTPTWEELTKSAPKLTAFDVLRALAIGGQTLAKAKGDAQLAVFDENGKLIGTVDPADLSPIASSASQAADAGADVADATDKPAEPAEPAAAPAAEAPKAEAPAAPAAATVPGTATVQAPAPAPPDENVAKAAIAEVFGDVFGPFAEQLRVVPELAKAVGDVQERLEKMAKSPDDRNSPKLFGATGSPGTARRDGEPSVNEFAALQKAVDDAADPGAKRDALQTLAYAKTKARFQRV